MEHLHQSNGFDESILRRHYGYFRHKLAKDFVETRVKLMTLGPGSISPTLSHEQGVWDSISAPDDVATEDYLDEYLEEALRLEPLDTSLQLCFLVLDPGMIQRELSIWQNAVETFRGCQQDLYLAPARMIAQRLNTTWNLESIIKPPTSHLTSDFLPSRKSSRDAGILTNSTETSYTLRWQSDLSAYTTDLNVYVWQPHLEQTPSVCYNSATIIMPSKHPVSRSGPSTAHRLLVVADPPSSLTRFLSTEDAFVRSSQTQHLWNADHETLRILAVLFKWIVDDSSVLVDKLVSGTRETMYRGRSMPTRSKIQYLLHLDDCRRLAIGNLQHARTVIDRAKSTVVSDEFCCQKAGDPDKVRAHEVFTGFQKDSEFLVDKLEGLEMPISTAREQIIEQMSLAQGQRALILTIAAAFFIPLSFVASIFGMNVKTPLFQHHSNSKASSSSASLVPTPTDTVDSSGPSQHYWDISQYLEISLPLTSVVILLPLIAGPCFRFVSQQYEIHRRHWRALFVVLVACYFVCLVCLVVISSLAPDSDLLLVYFIWSYPVLGMVCIVRVVRAYRMKQRRWRWSLRLLTLITCITLDVLYISPTWTAVPWALVSFLSMLPTPRSAVMWLRLQYSTWMIRKHFGTGYPSVTTV